MYEGLSFGSWSIYTIIICITVFIFGSIGGSKIVKNIKHHKR